MSLNGGYKIIDFKDIELRAGESASLKGLYEEIESNHRKLLIFSGINIGGVEYPDTVGSNFAGGDAYSIEFYGVRVQIANDDTITVVSTSQTAS